MDHQSMIQKLAVGALPKHCKVLVEVDVMHISLRHQAQTQAVLCRENLPYRWQSRYPPDCPAAE